MSEKTETELSLKERVKVCRDKLKELGVRNARYYFAKKYPEYAKDDKAKTRLDNLFFCKISDEQFTKDLEAFTSYKEVEFK